MHASIPDLLCMLALTGGGNERKGGRGLLADSMFVNLVSNRVKRAITRENIVLYVVLLAVVRSFLW